MEVQTIADAARVARHANIKVWQKGRLSLNVSAATSTLPAAPGGLSEESSSTRRAPVDIKRVRGQCIKGVIRTLYERRWPQAFGARGHGKAHWGRMV